MYIAFFKQINGFENVTLWGCERLYTIQSTESFLVHTLVQVNDATSFHESKLPDMKYCVRIEGHFDIGVAAKVQRAGNDFPCNFRA